MKTHIISLAITLIISSCSTENDWYVLKSPALGFEIEFPTKPEFSQQTSMLNYGRQEFDFYILESADLKSDNLYYIASRTVYPDSLIGMYGSNIDAFFNSAIKRSIESVQGKKISDRVINLQEYPGREVKVEIKNGEVLVTMRLYLVNRAGYMIQTASFPDNDRNESQKRFFSSFKLLKEE